MSRSTHCTSYYSNCPDEIQCLGLRLDCLSEDTAYGIHYWLDVSIAVLGEVSPDILDSYTKQLLQDIPAHAIIFSIAETISHIQPHKWRSQNKTQIIFGLS